MQVINIDTGKVMNVLVGTPSPAVGEVNGMFGRMWKVVKVERGPQMIEGFGIIKMDKIYLKELNNDKQKEETG